MLVTKKYAMWTTDNDVTTHMRICEKKLWNDYAQKFIAENKPTEYRLVMESDDYDELARFANLVKG